MCSPQATLLAVVALVTGLLVVVVVISSLFRLCTSVELAVAFLAKPKAVPSPLIRISKGLNCGMVGVFNTTWMFFSCSTIPAEPSVAVINKTDKYKMFIFSSNAAIRCCTGSDFSRYPYSPMVDSRQSVTSSYGGV